MLLNALPAHPTDVHAEVILSGEVPSPLNHLEGCRFHPRCPQAMPICAEVEPQLCESFPGMAWPVICITNRRPTAWVARKEASYVPTDQTSCIA